MPTLHARSLTREYRLHCPSAAVLASIAAIGCTPEVAGTALEPVDLTVEASDGFLSLVLPDGRSVKGNPMQIIFDWRRFMLREAGASHVGQAFLPAASIIGPTGRLLLIAGHRSGRTTLALHMLMRGFPVEGDEHALVDWGGIVMRPGRMVAAADLPRLVPAARGLFDDAPKQRGWAGQTFAHIDPTLSDQPWRIGRGPVSRLIFLELNAGGRSVLGRLTAEDALTRMIAVALMPDAGVAMAAARLRALAMAAPASCLSLGDLGQAAWHIERATASDRC